MHDNPFPDPLPPLPAVALPKRERSLWPRHEADLERQHAHGHARATVSTSEEARVTHLVLGFVLAVLEGQPSTTGSFAQLTGLGPRDGDDGPEKVRTR